MNRNGKDHSFFNLLYILYICSAYCSKKKKKSQKCIIHVGDFKLSWFLEWKQ